jgi:predicted RND superfamily exporter protein
MKDKWIIFIILGILIVFLIFQQHLIRNSEPSTDEKLLQKIEVLEKKIDSLSNKKDSVKTIIVEIEKTIDKNHKNYEKVVNTILNSDDSTNYVWAKQYIEEYRLKHSK